MCFDFAPETNPLRTVQTIAYLRKKRGLPSLGQEEPNLPPELPVQEPGPYFALSDSGVVTFAPPEDVDQQGNNIAQLRALHPELRELARKLCDVLSRGNMPHADLGERVRSYLSLVDQDLASIPFARLYVEGVRLQNAADAATLKIADKELPAFDASMHELLYSTLALHGSFILATADGTALLLAEERYQRRPHEEQEFRVAALALAHELQNRPEIIDPRAADFVLKSAEEVGKGAHLERSVVVGSATTKNATIVLLAGATLGALPIIGGVLGGPPGIVGGGIAALVGVEGLKKTRAFIALASFVTRGVDHRTEENAGLIIAQRASRLAPHAAFVLKFERLFRRLAEKNSQFRWLNPSLDWLKENSQSDEKKP